MYKIQANSSGTRSIEVSEEHLQTIEDYHGHKIYYSIGNFIFDPSKPLNAKACIVRLTITNEKDGLQVETIPINIQRCVPVPL